jgi:hypothetical protein
MFKDEKTKFTHILVLGKLHFFFWFQRQEPDDSSMMHKNIPIPV